MAETQIIKSTHGGGTEVTKISDNSGSLLDVVLSGGNPVRVDYTPAGGHTITAFGPDVPSTIEKIAK